MDECKCTCFFIQIFVVDKNLLFLSAEPSVREMKNFSLDNKKLHGIVMLDNGYPKPLCSGNFEVIIVYDKSDMFNLIRSFSAIDK